VGERAVALVCHENSLYWYRSQWGGTDAMLDRVFDAASPLLELTAVEWTFWRRTDEACLARLDALTTAVVYLVSTRGLVVCCPLWFGLGTSSPRPDLGVLVPVASLREFRACRVALRRFKGNVLDAIHDGQLTPIQARELLWRCFRLVDSVCQSRW
jgi:hypothetical protein